MSDENVIEVKYAIYAKGNKWYVSKEGILLNDFGQKVICTNCCEENDLNSYHDGEQLLKMGAYFKEYGERIVKCQCCDRVVVDEHLKPEQDLEKLKRKELII